MQPRIGIQFLFAALCLTSGLQAQPKPAPLRHAVVLEHGAFAASSSWNGVIERLSAAEYKIVAAGNPLRSLRGDAAYVAAHVNSIDGPVLLVGNSYGGEVTSEAASRADNVRRLVFVTGLIPDAREGDASMGVLLSGATLNAALAPPVSQPDGTKNLCIALAKFWQQFAADVQTGEAIPMAVRQRPAARTQRS